EGEIGMPRRPAPGKGESTLNQAVDPAQVVETTLRVRYSETDQMGVVYYANYLVWFEVARGAFCRARGLDYRHVQRDGLSLPVLEAHCRYLAPALYDDEILVRTWVTESRRRLLRMQYEVEI